MQARFSPLAADLQRIFGVRFQCLVAYGDTNGGEDGVHTLALVDRLTFEDLAGCAPLVTGWRRAGIAVPLLLSRDEFVRTLDVFPIEYGDIIATHVLIAGEDPFTGLRIADGDLRRACELQAKSHLIHLREGYLESGGRPEVVAAMMGSSSPALNALITHLDRLEPGSAARAGLTPEIVQEVADAGASTIADPSALFARYVGAVERLWQEVDRWKA